MKKGEKITFKTTKELLAWIKKPENKKSEYAWQGNDDDTMTLVKMTTNVEL